MKLNTILFIIITILLFLMVVELKLVIDALNVIARAIATGEVPF